MAEPRTTAEILAAPDVFKAACERARLAFQNIEGVVAVGHGVKQVDGRFGNELAIMVFVREKKPADSLAPAERIPPVFEGYRTDVRVMPVRQLQACDNTAKYSTIQGGIQSIVAGVPTQAGTQFFAGTLGCIVRRRNDAGRENVYMLSNAHVMYAMNHGRGDNLLHPGTDGGVLGPIQDGGAFRNIPWPPGATPDPDPDNPAGKSFIDCAIARLDLDSCCGCTKDTTDFAESIIDLNSVTPPGAGRGDPVHAGNRIANVRDVFGDLAFEHNAVVKKVGRTTGLTQGTCVGVGHGFFVTDFFNPGGPNVHAFNCIEIAPNPAPPNCKGKVSFSEDGDSGALILDEQNRAVGVLTSGPLPTDPPGTSSFACHIVPVLDHLGICIPCTAGAGTAGHGASLATDGSGLAPIPLRAAQSTLAAGQIVFTADGAAAGGEQRTLPTATAPAPVNEEEARRMHAHLEEFRRTRLGVPLHAVIGEVRKELGYLVRNVRPVKVAWGRHQGPAWLAHVLNHIRGYSPAIPHEVKDVTRRALLMKMREMLSIHGSNPLNRALAQYGDEVLEMLTFEGCDSVEDLIAWIQKREREQDLERAREKQQPVEDAS